MPQKPRARASPASRGVSFTIQPRWTGKHSDILIFHSFLNEIGHLVCSVDILSTRLSAGGEAGISALLSFVGKPWFQVVIRVSHANLPPISHHWLQVFRTEESLVHLSPLCLHLGPMRWAPHLPHSPEKDTEATQQSEGMGLMPRLSRSSHTLTTTHGLRGAGWT